MATQLSEHFTLEEFIVTDHRGIDNTPPGDLLDVLAHTAACMEKIIPLLGGRPLHINSAYRCPELNALVGGSHTSQHMKGEAVDFICPAYGTPKQICETLLANRETVDYDQLIYEFTWVHVSFTTRYVPRKLVMTRLASGGYELGIVGA